MLSNINSQRNERKQSYIVQKKCSCGQTDTKKEMRMCMEINITFTINIPK